MSAYPPSRDESVRALLVAAEVRDLVDQFAETGKCKGSSLIALGAALYELENVLCGGGDIWERYEDLMEDSGEFPMAQPAPALDHSET